MKGFYEVLNERHSIREYEPEKVPKSKILKIIKAAAMAPSGGNTQPWRFYVVQGEKKRARIVKILHDYYKIKEHAELVKKHRYRASLEKFYSNLGNAPCFVFVFSKKAKGFPEEVLDASAVLAGGNLMNAAAAEGLGTCWINAFAHKPEKISRLLGAPKDEKLVVPLVLGHPRKGYKPLAREKKMLDEVLVFA